jgi:protein-S-isoprenylcysteine O-methyltransferase Ste14
MLELISPFAALPTYGLGGLAILLLYALQSELRFGARARSHRTGAADRRSTLIVSLSAAVPVLGFVLAMKAGSSVLAAWLPHWFREAVVPGLPLVAWIGVLLGAVGLALRLSAVLTLRDRYTRTLLVGNEHSIELTGPYRWVRHPGYLGSLLCLNGIALASGNVATLIASFLATSAAYAYRIKVEDEMLAATLGRPYVEYRQQVRALLPFARSARRPNQTRPEARRRPEA